MQDNITQNQAETESSSGMNLEFIYYVLFRHKRCVMTFGFLGLLAAGIISYVKRPLYYSEAKLLVRFVMEARSISTVGAESQMKSPDARGESIINSEIEILNSRDLINRVVSLISPENILAKLGGGNNPRLAALAIAKSLHVDVAGRSTVIRIAYEHPDSKIAQSVVETLVDEYLKRYLEIHRTGGQNDFLMIETVKLRDRLRATQEELRKLRGKAGIVTLDESKKGFAEQITQLRLSLNDAQSELISRKAALERMAPADVKAQDFDKPVSMEQVKRINAYRDILTRLEAFQSKERDLLAQFTDDHPRVKATQTTVAKLEKEKAELEEKDPELSRLTSFSPKTTDKPAFDVFLEQVRIAGLNARVDWLNKQLTNVFAESAGVEQAELEILETQRKYKQEEANYNAFVASLEQSQLDAALRPDRMSDIQVVQRATTPIRTFKDFLKAIGFSLGAALALGIGLAFLNELVFDQSVKRTQELETRLGLPVFLAIPDIEPVTEGRSVHYGRRSWLPWHGRNGLAPGVELNGNAGNHLKENLNPFYGALRDRVVMSLERMTHKPKLVAVTGSKGSSGVTSIASGLATALSETAEGRVLLVDMNGTPGVVHPFVAGKSLPLEEALEDEKRGGALVQENLYVATATDTTDQRMPVWPRQLAKLIPKLKASDYDYIIFDMPPVQQTSVTPRLAGLMDLVLLVVEAEKVGRDVVHRANTMLLEAKGNVAAVLNRRRSYIPGWLYDEPL